MNAHNEAVPFTLPRLANIDGWRRVLTAASRRSPREPLCCRRRRAMICRDVYW
jgi:hypothetical protein